MNSEAAFYENLALSKRPLAGSEMRRLRHHLCLSQVALASLLGVRDLTVARWEKEQRHPPRAAEALLRLLYLEHIGKPVKIMDMLAQMETSDV